jgi:hypothetical protein
LAEGFFEHDEWDCISQGWLTNFNESLVRFRGAGSNTAELRLLPGVAFGADDLRR